MPKNPQVEAALRQAREELARLRAEKARLYPANPHPLAQRDRFPQDYTPEQIKYHKQLSDQIEALEERIDELEQRLYTQ